MSKLLTFSALSWINVLLCSTVSPIKVEKVSSASPSVVVPKVVLHEDERRVVSVVCKVMNRSSY